MRITGGRFAGLPLQVPKGPRIRPTQDRVRQALFNLLGKRIEGARVLDLFAGSGALGLEALSRGAAHATFVDRSGFSVRAITENLNSLTLGKRPLPHPRCRVLRAGALEAIHRLSREGAQFDLVFLDPPYGGDAARKALNALGRYAIVSPSSCVVVEYDKRDSLPAELEGETTRLALQRLERYGDTTLAFYDESNSGLSRHF